MGPVADAGRELLDELDRLEGSTEGRLRLELLNHLVTVGLQRGDESPDLLTFTATHFGLPAAARILSRRVETLEADHRADETRRWISFAYDASDVAKAAVIAAAAPYLEQQEDAYLMAMELTSEPLWVGTLLALGRIAEARASASGELLARVRAVTTDVQVTKPPASPDDPWWRAVTIAGRHRGIHGLGEPERTDAVHALVGMTDGAWQLLALRRQPMLRSVVDEADRSGETFLVTARQRATPTDVERLRSLLSRLDHDGRIETAHGLVLALMEVAAIGSARPTGASPPASAPGPVGDRGRDQTRDEETRFRLIERLRGAIGTTRSTEPRASEDTTGPDTQDATPHPPEDHRQPGVVSTGFGPVDDPGVALDVREPLRRARPCAFWLEVGPQPAAGSIEVEHVPLPVDLPERARLTVALFAFDGGFVLQNDATTGVLELAGDGTGTVVRQGDGSHPHDATRRLWFPLVAPDAPGPARLRCSLYHRGVLVQSRVVTAVVGELPASWPAGHNALRSVVDYQLFRVLHPAPLRQLHEHRASLLLNDDGSGTHGLRFAAVDGEDVITRDVSIGEGAIADQIRMARHALRRVSWGSDEQWSEDRTYRYAGAIDEAQLTTDLVALASNGARFFQLLVEEVAASGPDVAGAPDPYLARDRIAEVLRAPGRVQIALQRAPNHILPAALFYDHRFTDSAPIEDYRLCPDFSTALRRGDRLEEASCFRGGCPQARHGADLTVVCPSGFWGFRHELGFPVTLGDRGDATELIACSGGPTVAVAVSTELASHTAHVEGLRRIVTDLDRWRFADTRDGFLASLPTDDRQIIYLYCHGGAARNVPYVRVGEVGARPVTRLDLANERVRWPSTRPLVILNGCHTTALDPETAIDFVRFFVQTALASGVIGTEITVFEELGQAFGEAFMARFLVAGTTVGEAVRGARLDLLQAGNPLGLVYIPFAMSGLQLGATPG